MKVKISIVLCLLVAFSAVCSKDFYVAVDGSDVNPGTKSKPFASQGTAAMVSLCDRYCRYKTKR